MTGIWNRLDGNKANIGMVLGAILVALCEAGICSTSDTWVRIAAIVIAAWTGVAVSLKANKGIDAVRKRDTPQ